MHPMFSLLVRLSDQLGRGGDHVAAAADLVYFLSGREFFVGLSKRTNILGAKAVASAFPEYPVSLIKVTRRLIRPIFK